MEPSRTREFDSGDQRGQPSNDITGFLPFFSFSAAEIDGDTLRFVIARVTLESVERAIREHSTQKGPPGSMGTTIHVHSSLGEHHSVMAIYT